MEPVDFIPRLTLCLSLILFLIIGLVEATPTTILVDTDVDSEDTFALLYLLKHDRSLFNLKAVTISANAWSDAGHAANFIYDMLHMMGRDDIQVGVGGDGGISYEGAFSPNVGGYLSLIDQGNSTWGECRYKQAIPPGSGGLLDIDTMFGFRAQFLPRGERHYEPLIQATVQEVMLEVLSEGPTVVLLIGSHTNFATLLMTHPEIKENVSRIYVMGGGVNSSNPTGCCAEGSPASCVPSLECGIRGNLFDAIDADPWAEFNIFADPFAAYVVFHSGLPITLVPLDATNTIPFTKEFYNALAENQHTYESQWVYKLLKMTKDTWYDDNFFKDYFMWDSFTAGVMISGILTNHSIDKNAYCVIEDKKVTVVTSNEPYGVNDGSNPSFDNRTVPRFNLEKGGVHSGHVITGLQDPFCLISEGKGKCMDGYTMADDIDGADMQVGVQAKKALIDPFFTFQSNFIERMNDVENSGLYNLETQFPCYKEVMYTADDTEETLGRPVIFDMDISPGDIITLLYLLKTPRSSINLKAVTVSANGWSNAGTIDVVYDILHMMGRDDIPVGLGEFFSLGQAHDTSTGECKYRQWIPIGSGGFIDSDTVFGLARELPIAPRRYTAENSVEFGAPRNTDHPELRQPRAQEVIKNVLQQYENGSVSILTGGPLTNIATFLESNSTLKSVVKDIYVAGGSIKKPKKSKHYQRLSISKQKHSNHLGNVFTYKRNTVSEFNFFLDPEAAQKTIQSDLEVTIIPLDALRGQKLAYEIHWLLNSTRLTPEAEFVYKLLSKVLELERQSNAYAHSAKLMEEVLAAVALTERGTVSGSLREEPIVVVSSGDLSVDGWSKMDSEAGKNVKYLSKVKSRSISNIVAVALNRRSQSAKVGSFTQQAESWSTCK